MIKEVEREISEFENDILDFLQKFVINYAHLLYCEIKYDKIVIYLTNRKIYNIVKSLFSLFCNKNINSIYFERQFDNKQDIFVIKYKDMAQSVFIRKWNNKEK